MRSLFLLLGIGRCACFACGFVSSPLKYMYYPSGSMKEAQILAADNILLRHYQLADEMQVKKLFQDGMMSNTLDFVLTIARSPPVFLSILGMYSIAGIVSQFWLNAFPRTVVALVAFSIAGVVIPFTTLYALSLSFFRKYVEYSLKSDLSAIEQVYEGGGRFLVAEKNGEIVGMVGGELKDAKNGVIELRRMSVSRKVRNRKLGTTLIQALEKEIQPKKMILSCISTQYGANALYRRAGFTLMRRKAMFDSGVRGWLCRGLTYNFYQKLYRTDSS